MKKYSRIPIILKLSSNVNFFDFVQLDYSIENKIMNESFKVAKQLAERENPQLGFDKILGITGEGTKNEYKGILDSMREDLNFEKHVIPQILDFEVTKVDTSLLKMTKIDNKYRNYQSLMKYALKKKQAQQFRQQVNLPMNPITKKHNRTLTQFLQNKKRHILTADDRQQLEFQKIQIMMKNSTIRQQILEEALLFERLYMIERQLSPISNKYDIQQCFGRTHNKIKIDKKKKNLGRPYLKIPDLNKHVKNSNPRHIRLTEKQLRQNDFLRRRYIQNLKGYKFYNHLIKLQQKSIKIKQQSNSQLLSTLMKFNQKSIVEDKQQKIMLDSASKTNKNQIDGLLNCQPNIHRLFVRYCELESEDNENICQSMSISKVDQFMSAFSLQYQKNQKIMQILSYSDKISQFDFLQILHLLSVDGHDETDSCINQFVTQNIWSKPSKYLLIEQINMLKIKKYILHYLNIHHILDKVQQLYHHQIIEKRLHKKIGPIDFNELLQLMWSTKIYPYLINKKKILYYFLYVKNETSGLKYTELIRLLLILALSLEGQAKNNVRIILNKVLEHHSKIQT